MLDGDAKRVLDVPQGRNKWVQILETLGVEEWETIHAIGLDGQTLRARKRPEEEEGAAPPDDDTMQLPIKDAKDWAITRLVDCIEKLCETVRQGASDASARANIAENAYAKAVEARAKAEADAYVAMNSGGGESQLAPLVSAFVGGVQGGQQARGTNGAG
jgi:hypothetical protein